MNIDKIINDLIEEFGEDFVIDLINKEIKRRENGNQKNWNNNTRFSKWLFR